MTDVRVCAVDLLKGPESEFGRNEKFSSFTLQSFNLVAPEHLQLHVEALYLCVCTVVPSSGCRCSCCYSPLPRGFHSHLISSIYTGPDANSQSRRFRPRRFRVPIVRGPSEARDDDALRIENNSFDQRWSVVFLTGLANCERRFGAVIRTLEIIMVTRAFRLTSEFSRL